MILTHFPTRIPALFLIYMLGIINEDTFFSLLQTVATFNMTSSAIPVTDTPFESQSVKSATGKNRTKKGKKGKRPSASSRKLASGDGKGVEKDKKKVCFPGK